MAGFSFEVKIQDRELLANLKKLGDWRAKAAAPIGMALVRGTQQRFAQARSPDGTPWKKLLPAYAAIKRGPGILRASGMLMRSITFSASPDEVHVGTNRIYARVHQLGAVIKPKTPGGRLVFRLGGGGGTKGAKKGKGHNSGLVFVRSVTIPARPYLGISSDDERAIGDVIATIMGLRDA